MARTAYKEHLAMCYAVQYNGINLSELEEFSPGNIYVGVEEMVFVRTPITPMQVNVTDWVIDDPYIGYTSVITDKAFRARFDPTPQPP
jgi:hypothetical protein